MGVTFSVAARGASCVGMDFSTAGFARGVCVVAGFALTGLDVGLVVFTVTFNVAMGLAFVGGLAAFLGAAAFGVAFLGVALPGRFAALLGFFEGI